MIDLRSDTLTQPTPAMREAIARAAVGDEQKREDPTVSELGDRTSVRVAPTRLVAVENTHNSSGGRVWPLAEIDAIVAVCREHDLRIHLDGARLVNAATGSGVVAARIGRGFDTVTLCFS